MASRDLSHDTLLLLGALLVGWSAHWLITPINHPTATTSQYVWVWLQLIAGLALWYSAAKKARQKSASR